MTDAIPGGERFAATQEEQGMLSLCSRCKHKELDAAACTAFPDGIPVAFLDGDLDHTEPDIRDHGIQFEAVDGTHG